MFKIVIKSQIVSFRAGTTDTHMRLTSGPQFPGKEYAFLNKITDIISRAYRLVNFGKEFHHFFDVIAELNKKLEEAKLQLVAYRPPRFFSATRFANLF